MPGNFFDQFDSPPAASGPVYGAPPKVGRYEDEDQNLQRQANERARAAEERAAAAQARAEAEAERTQRTWEATHYPDGRPRPKSNETQISSSDRKDLAAQIDTFTSLSTAATGFKDDYGGNALGGIENWAQQYADVGTPGQREWWAAFKATDNQIRNDLFGSALTAPERQAYEATTVTPGMRPEIIRENVTRRAEIVRDALSRQREFMIANGYRPEAVDALFSPILQNNDALIANADHAAVASIGMPYAALPQSGEDGRTESQFGGPLAPSPGFSPSEGDRRASMALWGRGVFDETGRPLGAQGGPAYDENGEYLGLFGSVTDDDRDSPLPTDLIASGKSVLEGRKEPGNPITAGIGDIVEGGINNTVGLIANPVNTMAFRAAGYDDYTSDLGQTARDALGLPEGDPLISAINQGATAALGASGIARGVSSLARPGLTREIAQSVGSAPLADMTAGAAASGASELAREAGVGPVGQFAAGVAAGSPIVGLRAIATREMRPTPLAAAAERQGIDLMPADAGGTGTRMASGIVSRTVGGIPMAEGAERSLASAAAARDRVASEIGEVTDIAGAGQAAQRGSRGFVDSSAKRGSELFEQVSVPPKQEAVADNTRAALSEITQGFTSNPELSKIWTGHPRLKATLEALTPTDRAAEGRRSLKLASENLLEAHEEYARVRYSLTDPATVSAAKDRVAEAQRNLRAAERVANSDPVGGTVSWEDMKRLRSIVGEIVGQPSLSSDGAANSAMRKLYGALTTDMEATAASAGPRALSEFRRANQYWRGREDRINNVLSAILGDKMQKGEEATFQQVNRWAQSQGGDAKQLSRFIRSLPKDEAGTVRATILSRMGQAKPGQQNLEGTQFSPAEFATQWHKMSDRAKSALFPDVDHRRSIDDLAVVMDGMKRAGQFSNFSNTSLGTNAAAHTAGALSAPITTAIITASEFGLGKLLSSPGFARWLARTPESSPSALRLHVTRLGSLASREAAIAGDARALQQHLREVFNQSPSTKLAAEEKDDDVRRKPIGGKEP